MRQVENKKKDIGWSDNHGYIRIGIRDSGIHKNYQKHRFIFECFHGKINDVKLVVDHINNTKTDNRLENLQSITQSQNVKKDHGKGKKLLPVKIRATNINSGESFDYGSIYECNKRLDIKTDSAQSSSNKCKN